MLLIENIKIYQDIDEQQVIDKAIKKARIDVNDVVESKIFKKSIDARNKNDVYYLYSVLVDVKDESKYNLKHYQYPVITVNKRRTSNYRPIIIGSGPSGLFCALTFIKYGYKPIIIEQGKPVEERVEDVKDYRNNGKLNTLSNVQFGEGGAGTFSDGKLNTNVNNQFVREVLETFYQFGAPKEITYLNKPHIGTDNLVNILKNIRKFILDNGGTYYFNTKFINFKKENDIITVYCIDDKQFETDALILAVGHSARDTYKLLKDKGVSMKRKIFSVGVRIEHLQEMINKSQYGTKTTLKLPSADYKLVYHGKDRSAYTFCMCPGGVVIASSSDEKSIVTNGISNFKRDGKNSNSAILVNVLPTDLKGEDVLEGCYFQKELEEKAFVLAGSNYKAPIQKVIDYQNNIKSTSLGKVKPTYLPGVTFSNLNELFPDYINQTLKEALPYFDTKIKGFNDPDSILTAVESRSSAPVTILRDETFNCSIKGIYPIGEGAGYAGGITTSAIDGIKAAIKIIETK